MSNPRVRLALTLGSGPVLQELECVDRPRRLRMSSRLIDVQDEQGRSVPLTLRERSSAASGDALDAAWALSETTDIRLAIRLQPDGRIRLTPSIANHAARPLVVTVAAPLLAGIRIAGEPDDCWYLLGTRGLILDNRPLKVQRTYCGEYPLQIVDLFAPRAGGGLGLMIEDDQLAWKTFAFEQAAGTATVAVRYPGVTVPASQTVTLPAAMLIPHTGDWHELFDASRRQLRRGPLGAGRMRDLFYCRRDYPLGGTGYLFDPARRAYTPLALIEESRRGLGGIDMIDISGWALHEKTGRVGDYLTNDLGGLDGLRRGIDAAHAAGVSVGLYTEGYLVDRRAPLAARALPAWQMIDHGGKPRWWAGEMEFFTCPGVADWREALSSMIAGAVRTTGADAVYLDEFGFCGPDKQCWSADHGHAVPSNPMIEESRMLAAVRAALDAHTPHVGIYIEQTPCDAMAHRVDAAFNYGMSAAGPQHPTGLPLMRFVFPELVTVEMVSQGIHPLPVSEADLHRCLFNGLAIWLKGRSESWYSPGFRDTARRAYAILDRHRDLFRSPDCDPLVPTLAPGIYANRFRTEAATLLTLYNARPTPCTGPLVEVFLPAGSRVQDLWSRQPLDIRRAAAGDAAVIAGSLEPHSVGLLLVTSEAASRPSADSPDRP